MPTNLDTLESLEQFQQELLRRLQDAHDALSQPNLGKRNAAQRALEEFRDYSALPDDHLREVAREGINDFLLQNIGDALNGLSNLVQELQAAAQQELHTARFVAPSPLPRQHLLRALSLLVAVQAQQNATLASSDTAGAAVDSRKLDKAIALIKDLLNPPPPSGATDKAAKPTTRRSTATKKPPDT